MGREIHFEIFRRVGARGGWTLHEVSSSRDLALAMAKELMTSEQATGVKVVKETYNDDTGDYLTLKIFEDGHNQMKLAPAQEEAPNALPCFKPEDLYSYHARATMHRLVRDFLTRNTLTITELIHRADMLEKFEATGTAYQHAIQKVAVAQAASTTVSVQQIIKSLNELTTKAIHRVYRDQRAGLFPDPHAEQFAELAGSLWGQGNAAYVFNGALARHLKEARGWDEKVLMLITILDGAPAEDPSGEQDGPRKLVLSSVDAILAEILNGAAALQDLMGPSENLGQALNKLVSLFLGKPPEGEGRGQGLAALTQHFAGDTLPEARTAVAKRIISEFKSSKRLCPDSMVEELKALRSIANRIVLGVGKYLSHDDLITAFTLRSKRLVAQEALGSYLTEATPDDKIERLLFVEDNVIGAENKRQLGGYVMPILTSAPFENMFQNPRVPLMQRLQRLAQLQLRVRRSGFVDVTRDAICQRMDALAVQMEARNRLFDSIEARPTSPVDKAQTLIKLLTGGFLTEGALSARARDLILAHLSRPGFLGAYTTVLAQEAAARKAQAPDREQAMAGLMEILGKAGITPETGLKNIAA